MSEREHDVVLFGASGFVGRLVAEHLAQRAGPGVRVALAGRTREKVEQVRDGLPGTASSWPVVVADSSDRASLDALAASATAVATTVGPYLRHGLPLVEACAAAGTSYADLTGEVLFVRRSADAAHEAAQATGAKIVHACGFDSVPSDLGVLLAAQAAQADGTGELTEATLVLRAARGGTSGGTVDSLRMQIDEMRRSTKAARLAADPYALSPDRDAEADRQGGDVTGQRDAFLATQVDGRWVAPFVMGPFNTRVVRRSNALSGFSYGRDLRYREVMSVGGSPVAPALAAGVAVGTGAMALGMATPGVRTLLDRVLPAPGEGPSEEKRRSGHFHTETLATTTSGARYRTTVKASGDPGYAATSVMIGETVLALGVDDLPPGGGVLTPATAVGVRLAERLREAGFTITTERVPTTS